MKLKLTKEELKSGLEIKIKGLNGDPTEYDNDPEDYRGTSVLLEYHDKKFQLHVWTDSKEDCQTIILN